MIISIIILEQEAMQMLKIISAMEARKNLGQIMNKVSLSNDEYIIERAGKPLVAVITIQEYQRLKNEREQAIENFFKTVDKNYEKTKNIPLEEIETAIEEAVKAAKKQELKELQSKI
jgi:prevent-host-death family protein